MRNVLPKDILFSERFYIRLLWFFFPFTYLVESTMCLEFSHFKIIIRLFRFSFLVSVLLSFSRNLLNSCIFSNLLAPDYSWNLLKTFLMFTGFVVILLILDLFFLSVFILKQYWTTSLVSFSHQLTCLTQTAFLWDSFPKVPRTGLFALPCANIICQVDLLATLSSIQSSLKASCGPKRPDL